MERAVTQLPGSARVWIYLADRPIVGDEAVKLQADLDKFAQHWVSHDRQLNAAAELVHNQFILLAVDESQAGASGCSIDASVNFLRALQQAYGLELFDRMRFAYMQGHTVSTLKRDDFEQAYQKGEINDQTIVFDTLVKTVRDLENWKKPLGESWHARLIGS